MAQGSRLLGDASIGPSPTHCLILLALNDRRCGEALLKQCSFDFVGGDGEHVSLVAEKNVTLGRWLACTTCYRHLLCVHEQFLAIMIQGCL